MAVQSESSLSNVSARSRMDKRRDNITDAVQREKKQNLELELKCISNNEVSTHGPSSYGPPLDEATRYALIHDAAYNNELETVKALIEKDASQCESLTCCKETAIMIACLNGCFELVKYLSEYGVNLRHRTSKNSTVVHYAASSGCPRTLRYVLRREGMTSYVNSSDQEGNTPAHYAMRGGCADCVRVLAEYRADFNLRNLHSQSPIDIAKSLGNVRCLDAMQDNQSAVCEATTAVGGIQSNPTHNQRSCDPLDPPESLRNDEKAEFHATEAVETATLQQGNNLSTLQGQGSTNGHSREYAVTVTNGHGQITQQNGRTSDSAARDQTSRDVPLPPTQPMKPKNMINNGVFGDTPNKAPRAHTSPAVAGGDSVCTESSRDVPLPPTQPMKPKNRIKSAPLFRDTQNEGPVRQIATENDYLCTEDQSSRDAPLPPTQSMKPKTVTKNGDTPKLRDKGQYRPKRQTEPSAPKSNATTYQAAYDDAPCTNRVQICPFCGKPQTHREFHFDGVSGIIAGHTHVSHAQSLKYTESACYNCTMQSYNRSTVENDGSPVNSDMTGRYESEQKQMIQGRRDKSESEQPTEGINRDNEPAESESAETMDRKSEPTENTDRESELTETECTDSEPTISKPAESELTENIDTQSVSTTASSQCERSQSPESDIPDWTTPYEQDDSGAYNQGANNQEIFESGYHTMPGAYKMHEVPIKIERDIPRRMEVKFGEVVTLNVKATTSSSHQLKYYWYEVKGGKSYPVHCEMCELKWKIEERNTMTLFCRIYLEGSEGTSVDSRKISIIPKLVWFKTPLQFEGKYYGKRAVLKCQAEKHNSVNHLRYLWLKGMSLNDRLDFVKETSTGELVFDDLCTEHDGYYVCQADVESGFAESEKIHVKGCNEPSFQITRQPKSRVVDEGCSFKLQCRAEFKARNEGSLTYQWFHNGTAIRGAISSLYARRRAVAGDTGHYYCRVSGEGGASVCTEMVTVALAYKEETEVACGPRSLQQLEQMKAEKILQTSEGKRYAMDKVAILLGNTEYVHLKRLNSCVADVQLLKRAFTDAGFKVISLVNLSSEETMHALKLVRDKLVVGVYVVFVYNGHGCRVQTTDFIIPVDAHTPVNPSQCIARDTVCDYLQSKLCRVFIIMNCCSNKLEGSYKLPQYQYNNNYANKVIMTACLEGRSAYEVGPMSSFINTLVTAVQEGGSYKKVLERVQTKMRTNYESHGGSTFARPSIFDTGMDGEITFQDEIMLDDESLEDTLDQLQETCKAINTPPDPVRLTENLDPALQDVELSFECECSNVLVVVVKWSVQPSSTQTTTFTVDMCLEGQGVEVERSSINNCEACFRVSALQRLSGNLQLCLIFTISSSDEATPPHDHTVTYNLQSRPLYSLFSCP